MSALAAGVRYPHHAAVSAVARTADTVLLLVALCALSLGAVFLSTSAGSVAGADGLFGASGRARTQTIEGSFRAGDAADYASRGELRVAPVTRQRPASLDAVVVRAR